MRKLTAALAVTAAALFGVTACAGPEIVDNPPVETTVPEAEPEGDAPLPEEAYEPEDTFTATFGKTGYEYDDGLTVTVSEAKDFKPSEYAAFDPAPHYLKWTVTFTNDSDQPWRATDAIIYVSSAGTEYSEVYDDGVAEPPSVPIMPGKSASYDVAFGVEDPNDVLMSVTPDWEEHTEVLFTN